MSLRTQEKAAGIWDQAAQFERPGRAWEETRHSGETIAFAWQSAAVAGDPLNEKDRRPVDAWGRHDSTTRRFAAGEGSDRKTETSGQRHGEHSIATPNLWPGSQELL